VVGLDPEISLETHPWSSSPWL